MNRASGSRLATTITVIHGKKNATGATDLATRRGGSHAARNGTGEEHHARPPYLDGASSWSARGCATHRRRRLPGRAQLFDRFATRGGSARDAHHRTAR